MKQTITFVSATFGNLNIVVNANPNYKNTFEIGNKRIDFTNIVGVGVDIRNMDFDIIIFDGVKSDVAVIYEDGPYVRSYVGTIRIWSPKREEILVYKLEGLHLEDVLVY